jgi:hypothetical protein
MDTPETFFLQGPLSPAALNNTFDYGVPPPSALGSLLMVEEK